MAFHDILSMLDGWEYEFPTIKQELPINTTDYVTLYSSKQGVHRGSTLFATLVLSTNNFNVRITAGNAQREVNIISSLGVLYGQAPAGALTPSVLVANAYLPSLSLPTYKETVWSSGTPPASSIGLLIDSPFPFKDGIKFEIQALQAPQTVFEFSIGNLYITDEQAYLKSLQRIYGSGK